MGRVAESITDLKQAVELEQSKPESHNNLGLSYLEIGKLEDAVEHFRCAEKRPRLPQPQKSPACPKRP